MSYISIILHIFLDSKHNNSVNRNKGEHMSTKKQKAKQNKKKNAIAEELDIECEDCDVIEE